VRVFVCGHARCTRVAGVETGKFVKGRFEITRGGVRQTHRFFLFPFFLLFHPPFSFSFFQTITKVRKAMANVSVFTTTPWRALLIKFPGGSVPLMPLAPALALVVAVAEVVVVAVVSAVVVVAAEPVLLDGAIDDDNGSGV
jgi:hypothetical protein